MKDHYVPPDACVPMHQAFQKGDWLQWQKTRDFFKRQASLIFSAHTGSQEWLMEDACPMFLWVHGLRVIMSVGCTIILSRILQSCRISSFILACTPYWFFDDADGKLPQVNHTCLEVGQFKMQNAKISSPKLSAPIIPVFFPFTKCSFLGTSCFLIFIFSSRSSDHLEYPLHIFPKISVTSF